MCYGYLEIQEDYKNQRIKEMFHELDNVQRWLKM